MFTQTAKQILSPIADAISQLLVVTSDVEIHGLPMQDLTEVAVVVDEQAANLVQVGQSMMESGDEQLQQHVPVACNQIAGGGALLVQAANHLKLDPFSKQGRTELLDACRGILQGSTALLSAFDDGEVRRILRLCQECKQQVQVVEQLVEIGALLPALQAACQSVVDLGAIVNARIQELLHVVLQERLARAVEKLNQSSSLLVSSCKVVAANPDDPMGRQSRKLVCQDILSTLSDVETIVQIAEYNEPADIQSLRTQRQDLQNLLVELAAGGTKKTAEDWQSSLDTFQFTADILVQDAGTLITATPSIEAAQDLSKALKMVQTRREEVVKGVHGIMETGNNTLENASELHAILVEASDAFYKLDAFSDRLALTEVQEATWKLSKIQSLLANTKELTADTVEIVQQDLAAQLARLTASLDHTIAISEDEKLGFLLRFYAKDWENLASRTIISAKTVTLRPEDTYALEHHQAVVAHWRQNISCLELLASGEGGVFTVSGLVSAECASIRERMHDLKMAKAEGNSQRVEASIRCIHRSMDQLSKLAISHAEKNTDPAYKLKISDALASAKKGIQSEDGSVCAIVDWVEMGELSEEANDSGLTGEEQFLACVNSVESILAASSFVPSRVIFSPPPIPSLLPTTATQYVKKELDVVDSGTVVEADNIQTIDGEEMEVVHDRPAPEPLSEDEAKENPIKAAAQDLRVTASKWSTNPMIDLANGLSAQMAHLSLLYKENTPQARKDLIRTAKEIQEETRLLCGQARHILEACTDKVLAKRVGEAMETVDTISQQLKIVAAVKAAEPKDPDSEKQLIRCATNLMNAVRRLLEASEIASIRVFRTASYATTPAIVKFRKILYRR